MAWKQVRTPKVMIQARGGWCLKYVDDTVDANLRQATATAAYNVENKNGNVKAERPPTGVYVPVFFSLSNNSAGHVALMLPDGRVASATKSGVQPTPYIHPNLDDLIRVYSSGRICRYLGWSTYCDGRQFVKWEADAPTPQPTPPTPTPAPDNTPKIGDRVTTTATHDQNGTRLNLKIINDGQSVFTEVNSKGNAVLRKGGVVRCGVPVSSLRKV